jgi:hypothetical protein
VQPSAIQQDKRQSANFWPWQLGQALPSTRREEAEKTGGVRRQNR